MSNGLKISALQIFMRKLEYDSWSLSLVLVGLHLHNVPQIKDKFSINHLVYCFEALISIHPLVY